MRQASPCSITLPAPSGTSVLGTSCGYVTAAISAICCKETRPSAESRRASPGQSARICDHSFIHVSEHAASDPQCHDYECEYQKDRHVKGEGVGARLGQAEPEQILRLILDEGDS